MKHKIFQNKTLDSINFYFMDRARKKKKMGRGVDRYSILLDSLVRRFLNRLIVDGKKERALLILLRCFYYLKIFTRQSPLSILRIAVSHCQPFINVNTVNKGQRSISFPVVYKQQQRIKLALNFLLEHASSIPVSKDLVGSQHNVLPYRLAVALLNAFFFQGPIFSKLYAMHANIKDTRNRFSPRFQTFMFRNRAITKKRPGYSGANRYFLPRFVEQVKRG